MQSIDYKQLAYDRQNTRKISSFYQTTETAQDVAMKKLINDLQEYLGLEHEGLVEEIILGKKDKDKLQGVISEWLNTQRTEGYLREQLIKKLIDNIIGWGIIQELIDDTNITDVFTNEDLEVVKRVRGEDILTNIKFDSEQDLEIFIRSIMIRTGRKINNNICIADGMDDIHNVRINAGISGSPIRREVVRAPYLALRAYRVEDFSREFFIGNETFNEEIDQFFDEYLTEANCLIVGEPGAGKSTILEYMQNKQKEKDPMRRVIRIEEEAELSFKSKNSVSFIERKTSEGTEDVRKQYSMAEFAKAATRLAGKEVVIGEVRGNEAWYLFRLLYMGYLAKYTIHGNSAAEGIHQTAFLMGLEESGIRPEHLMKRICDIMDFAIYVSNKKIVTVGEITGYNAETNDPLINPIFQLQLDPDGNLYWDKGTLSPEFMECYNLRQALKKRRV